MDNVGWAGLSVVPTFEGFQGKLEQGSSKAMIAAGISGGEKFGDTAGTTAGKRFGAKFKTFAKAGLLGIAGFGALAAKVGKDAVGAASDLNESLNAVNVSYGKNAKAVQKLGKQAATSLGLSNEEFNSLSVRFSAFSKTIAGSNGKKVVTTLDDLTTRAADFASVMNLEVAESAQLFQSGLAGETEPLRRYGLDLSAAKVEAFALSEGIVKNKDDLTEAAKVQARYGLLMQQTAQTQGDFKNTSGELANQQRILSARWEDSKAKLGTALLPVMKEVIGFVNKHGIPAFEKFSDWFVKDGVPAIKDFSREAKPFVKDVLTKTRDILREATPLAKKFVGFFKDVPSGVWQTAAAVGLLGTVGSKLPGVKAGLKVGSKGVGGLLGVATKAKPLPVWVVNEGFGGKGGPGGVPVGGLPSGKPTGAPKVPGLPNTWLTTKAPFWTKLLKGAPMLGASTGMRTIETTPITDPKDVKNLELQKFLVEQTTNAVVTQNNAWLKVRHDIDRGKGSIEAAVGEAFRLDGAIKKVEGRKQTKIEAPNLLNLLDQVQRYGSWLDGLDGRVVKTFITTRLDHNAGQLERFGHVEGVGATGGIVRRPTVALIGEAGPEAVVPLNRTRGNGPLPSGVTVINERVYAHDYQDFMAQMQRRSQLAALNGGWE